jgi:hypothetical protein
MTDPMGATSKTHDTRKLYQLLKKATWRKQQVSEIIHLEDGHIMTDQSVRLSIWKEVFQELLNLSHRPKIVPSPTSAVLQVFYKFCLKPPNIDEIKNSIGSLKNYKSFGKDGLPPELYKAADEIVATQLKPLIDQSGPKNFSKNWEVPFLFPFIKKDDKSKCQNCHGIAFTDIAANLFAILFLIIFNQAEVVI